MAFCFQALEGTKISSYEQVSSQKYENGYRTKICNFTVLKHRQSKPAERAGSGQDRTSSCPTALDETSR